MSIKVASPTADARNARNDQEGLSFEVRERVFDPDCDHVYTPGSPNSPISPVSPDSPLFDYTEIPQLIRSTSAALTDDTDDQTVTRTTSMGPAFQCSPAMATADGMFAPPSPPSPPISSSDGNNVLAPEPQDPPKDPNIRRLQLGENAETIALLHFLQSQGINTTKLVTQHMMKYGSLVRIAQTDEGKIIGCLIFDNETSVEDVRQMTPEEAAKNIGPFIFLQLLVVAPEHAVDASKRWKERLVESFKSCVVKNGKIAIIRGQANNQEEIAIYKSCGFLTMEDMGIPSYSSSKDNIEIMAYTPLGHEGTSEIFKKFYQMGARF
jgi:hypothetical protein